MPKRTATPRQMNLLDWTPPEAVESFDEQSVRASTIAGKICRGVSVALKEAAQRGLHRDQVARLMSEYLGADVSKNMLDAYASQAREEHIINVVRFIALVHATKDRRLLEMIAEMFGWAVIERRHLPMIKLAALNEKQDEMRREAESLRRQAQRGGSL